MMMMDFSVLDSLQRTGPNAYFFFWRGKGGGLFGSALEAF